MRSAPHRRMPDAEYCTLLCYGLLAALIAGSIYLLTHMPPNLSMNNGLIALGIIWLGAAPIFVYLLGSALDSLPFLPILGAAFGLFYGFTAFSHDHTQGLLGPSMLTTPALLTALLGLGLLYAGFAFTKYFFPGVVAPLRLPLPHDDMWLRGSVWLLMFAHLAFLGIPALQSLPSVSALQRPTGYAAFGMLYLLWRQKRLPATQKYLFFLVCIPAEFLWRFSTGALAQVVLLGLFLQIVIWYERRRIPWLLIIGTGLFFVQLQPVKFEYRKYTYEYGRYANANPLAKARLFAELVVKFYSGEIQVPESEVQGAAASRVAHIRVLSYVMQQTPEPIPYWNGETYKLLYASLVPRVFWPSKPMELVGQDFGHRYGLLAPDDVFTSINMPWLAEMYANFGMLGVLIGMPLIGCVFALLTEKFGASGMNYLSFIVGTTVLFQASVDQECNLSLVFGPIVFVTLLFGLYFHLVHWLSAPRSGIALSPAPFHPMGMRVHQPKLSSRI